MLGTRPRFRAYAWGVLAYSLLVILWGYFLRISESGDGCGTDWPLCNGGMLPGASVGTAEFPSWVEYIHRASSGITLLLVVGMFVWARRIHATGHAVRTAAGASLLLTLSESAFGAVLVVFGLVAEDISVARIAIRPFHATNTFLLMAALGLTAWWATRGTDRVPSRLGSSPAGRRALAGGAAVLLLAASGSWTGLATTAFPAETLSEGIGQYLRPEHLLIYLRMLHPLVALAAVVVLFRLVRAGREGIRNAGDSAGPQLALAVAVLVVAQMLVGPLTIALLQPVALRVFHLFLADVLWLTVVLLGATLVEADTHS
jgi:heme A synthase